MKKVIFCTNLPSPYRVDFFNELGKYCNLTVLYERHSSAERNVAWKGVRAENFKEIFLELKSVDVDRSKGSALRKYIKEHQADVLIFTNYVSLATIEAIIWCRLHRRKYYIEYDGGFNKKDSFLKGLMKRFLLNGAIGHLTTADEHIAYLISIGIHPQKIFKYHFTSLKSSDLEHAKKLLSKGKQYFREKLGIMEQNVILSVGRFSYDKGYGKGYDLLMKVASVLGPNTGIYIVGDDPTQEFLYWKAKENLENVHFVGFKCKKDLSEYYCAADIFTILSRGDVWGLVVNEAMMYSLPIVSSDKCIAGLELVKDNQNGFITSLYDMDYIVSCYQQILQSSEKMMLYGINSRKIISEYTIESMASSHVSYLNL